MGKYLHGSRYRADLKKPESEVIAECYALNHIHSPFGAIAAQQAMAAFAIGESAEVLPTRVQSYFDDFGGPFKFRNEFVDIIDQSRKFLGLLEENAIRPISPHFSNWKGALKRFGKWVFIG